MMKQIMAAALLITLAGTGAALADDDCHVPMAQWQPREAVERLATEKGWTVQRIKVDDGCYEVKGTNPEGQSIKVKIDPATLELVEMRIRYRD